MIERFSTLAHPWSCVRRRFARRKSASRPRSIFLANPSVSSTSRIERVGCCLLETTVLAGHRNNPGDNSPTLRNPSVTGQGTNSATLSVQGTQQPSSTTRRHVNGPDPLLPTSAGVSFLPEAASTLVNSTASAVSDLTQKGLDSGVDSRSDNGPVVRTRVAISCGEQERGTRTNAANRPVSGTTHVERLVLRADESHAEVPHAH